MNLKKTLPVFALMLALVATMGVAVAKNENGSKNKNQKQEQAQSENENTNGHAEHLYLYEKDSSNWSIIEDGAWGKMTYKEDKFVFNGHSLEASTNYTLISYKEPWDGCGSVELGTGTANRGGNVHIMGEMPEVVINDYPYGFGGDYEGVSGAKIWLVPTADVEEDGCFNNWNPTEYLFEESLIYETSYEHEYANQLDLVEKDSTNWSIVGDAGGTLQYDEYFMFDGQGLEFNTGYTLISYKEDWPGCGSVELGTGTSDGSGDVHITGVMDHVINDYPYGFGGDYEGVSGAKIWLVPTADKTGDCFNAWNPDNYLFETELIYEDDYEYPNQLDLVEKDSTNWSIVGDAGGTLQYDEYFMFDGQGLVAGEEYLLLSYKEDWPGCGSIKLGTGTADSNGDVRIVGEMDYVINDYPYGFGGDYEGVSGAKIWLVPTADKTGDCFNAWNPTEYLFENNLINQ